MAKGFKHGAGGGTSLNFKVVCNPQPSTAKENTIWVDTDKINNYYFSATQPENMVDYDVWFPVDTSSNIEFNALKKNGIQIYPISAKQYVFGKLVGKAAKSWQGGKWVEWITYLYNKGDECENRGGSWSNSGYSRSGYTISAPTKESNRFIVTGNGATTNGICGKQNTINLDGVNEIRANVTGLGTTNGGGFLIVSGSKAIPKDVTTLPAYTKFDSDATAGKQTIKVPVDTLNGNYYVCFMCGLQDPSGFAVEEVWFV